MVERYFKVDHCVKDYECDMRGRMDFPSLMKQLIYVSSLHYDAIETEVDHPVTNENISWIIMRYQVDLKSMPVHKQNIQIATESISYDRLFAYRHFDVWDEDQQLMGHVEAVFALMDLDKRRMVRMNEDHMSAYPLKEGMSKRIKRYPNPLVLEDDAVDYTKEYDVRYFDIDSNQHVNNSLYLTWSLDALDLDFLANHQIESAIIKYEKEVFYGDHIQSKAALGQDDQGLYSTHRIETADKLHAEIEYRWRKDSRPTE